jgi:hypothetical protein
MLRPPIRVARPADWTGALARAAVLLLGLMVLLVVLLVRLPPRWVALAFDAPELVRAVLFAVGLWLLAWVRAAVYSRLPGAPYLFGRSLVVHDRGARRRIPLASLADVHVDRRPPPVDEMIVVELSDGLELDVCPTRWEGAGALYAKLRRKLDRLAAATARRAGQPSA